MMEIEKKNPIGLKPDEMRRGNINWLNREYVRAEKMSLPNIGGD